MIYALYIVYICEYADIFDDYSTQLSFDIIENLIFSLEERANVTVILCIYTCHITNYLIINSNHTIMWQQWKGGYIFVC